MSVKSISPLDGRYAKQTTGLTNYFSEWALIKYRIHIEVEWLIAMSQSKDITHVRVLTENEKKELRALASDFDENAALRVKEIEKTTNHDVKSIEYYIKEEISGSSLDGLKESVHFCCTSEDINNLAYALMLRDGIQNEWLPLARQLVSYVSSLADRTRSAAMLTRTHGQPATPSTMGKELAVFVYRWQRQLRQLEKIEFLGKFNGVVGNFNAHLTAYPDAPWQEISRTFVTGLGLVHNPMTTQIESHDFIAELFHLLVRFNNILMDFDRDMWTYISMEYFTQKVVKSEVGSSVMPHKVNPINFENSEANIGVSNALLEHLATKLAISRLQRDLTDSSAVRNAGVAIGHSVLALSSALKGLSRVQLHEHKLRADLDDAWQVLAEPIQTVMRKAGCENPYEQMKELTRGTGISRDKMNAFIETLEIDERDKKRLTELTPAGYTGMAAGLVDLILV